MYEQAVEKRGSEEARKRGSEEAYVSLTERGEDEDREEEESGDVGHRGQSEYERVDKLSDASDTPQRLHGLCERLSAPGSVQGVSAETEAEAKRRRRGDDEGRG